MILLGVDTGGTFTDFVLWRDGRLRVHKLLSTPHAPEQAILQGIKDLGLAGEDLRMVHGSTVATNAVLEGKGGARPCSSPIVALPTCSVSGARTARNSTICSPGPGWIP